MQRPTQHILIPTILTMLIALFGCQPAADSTAQIALVEQAVVLPVATLAPSATPFPTATNTQQPTLAPTQTSTPILEGSPVGQENQAGETLIQAGSESSETQATRSAEDFISNLAGSSNKEDAPPALQTTAEPLPSITASPTTTATPTVQSDGKWQPPFQDGPTITRNGSQFGYTATQRMDLDTVKIGFHVGPGGDMTGLSEWMETLDAQGIPFFLKSVDAAGPLLEAQQLAKRSGVPHVLVYRKAGGWYELPNYENTPEASAREHWELQKNAFPPELDPNYVWLETMNEVDRNRSDWLGAFALETSKLALRDGYKWAAFGWSSGEPEYTDWQEPNMARFLAFAANHPDRIAVAIHEYSFINEDLMLNYPFQLGRFQLLFLAADRMNIRRPTVLITEFGWEYQSVPKPEVAMAQLREAAELYATYPEIKGAAIWYLGPGFGGVARQTQRLIEPTTAYAQSTYFERPIYKPIGPELFRDYWEKRGIEP